MGNFRPVQICDRAMSKGNAKETAKQFSSSSEYLALEADEMKSSEWLAKAEAC